ncbi:phage tail tip lysozyme [Nocardia vermiculata]|uniref:Phage tail lysozyme domain-containing protein n=1 Tax=Nocardia vermiculata TaxID=257274 RepID=A0A846XYY4_9NOCA|nr:phage tail tip lysozyme [Nocardia vermiculata]NKY49459.1 hypothetical protein [Nocardia vermiculata]
MSPKGTKQLGDVHDLPACAPDALKYLFRVAEAVIQEQIRMLGSGTPSKAPDMQKLLSSSGFSDPENESKMIDDYKGHKTEMNDATTGLEHKDKGVVVKTAGIGDAVTDAYSAIDTAVGELNAKVDASFKAVRTVATIDKNGNKSTHEELPKHIVDGLFKAAWETVNTTYDKAHGVTDKAAAAAVAINEATPPAPPPSAGGGQYPSSPVPSHVRQAAFNPSDGPAPSITEGQKPTAEAIYQYLLEKGFTPAQAAGIIGNMQIESGFETDAYNAGEGAIGLCQWEGGRRTNLEAFAAGKNLGDWRTQVDFMVHEMQTSESLAYSQVKAAQTPGEAAAAFDQYYERSSGEARGQRISAAQNFAGSMADVAV